MKKKLMIIGTGLYGIAAVMSIWTLTSAFEESIRYGLIVIAVIMCANAFYLVGFNKE